MGETIIKYWGGGINLGGFLPSGFLDWKALKYARVYAGKTLGTSEGRGSFSDRGLGPASKTVKLAFFDILSNTMFKVSIYCFLWVSGLTLYNFLKIGEAQFRGRRLRGTNYYV